MTDTSILPGGVDAPPPPEISRAAQVAAPLVAGVAAWAVRRVLDSGFRRATGHPAPSAGDVTVVPGRILLWACVTAVAVAAVNVAVDRVLLRPKARSDG